MSIQLLASAARTMSEASPDQSNTYFRGYRGVQLIIDVTAIAGSPSITVKIQGKDAKLSDKYYDLLTSAAITATGTYVMKLYPGLVAGANVANDVLPGKWRIQYVAGTADSVTASIGANLLL